MTTINMQTLVYINLLDKASHVKTKQCFVYNNTIFFAVPKQLVSQAIGPNASYVKKIRDNLGKKVKIISAPEGPEEMQKFIEDIVSPTKFKSLEIRDNTVIITAGSNQNKASLIGRNRRRFSEMHKVIHDIFNMDLRIV
ncbi:MAG: hypothetical protein AABX83_00175 [Nanoarchaeota archaeon]